MSSARSIRIGAWVALALLIGASFAASMIPLASPFSRLNDLVYLVALYVAAGLAIVCARAVRGLERRFWGLLAAALVLTLVSETYWTLYTMMVDPAGPALPHPFELLQVGAALAMIAMILSLTEFGTDPWPARARIYLDVLAVQIIGFALVFVLWTEPLFERVTGGHSVLGWIGAFYPVLGLSILGGMTLVLWRRPGRWHVWEVCVLGSVALFALGLVSWPTWYASLLVTQIPPISGSFVSLAVAGFGVMAVGIVYRLTESGDPTFVARRFPKSDTPVTSTLFTIALALSVVGLYLLSLTPKASTDRGVLLGATILLALAAGARDLTLSLEGMIQRRRASVDPVTGLQLLSGMRDALEAAVNRARDTRTTLTVGSLGVDGYKQFVIARGNDAADALLVAISEQLVATLGRRVYRAGDSSFLVMFDARGEEPEAELRRAIDRIRNRVTAGTTTVWLYGAIARYPRDGSDPEQLLDALSDALDAASTTPGGVLNASDIPDTSAMLVSSTPRARAHVTAVRALASALEQRDLSLLGHGRAVADLSRRLGEVMGLTAEELRSLELAAIVHDVGKVGVPDRLLTKPDALTESEYEQVHEHAVLGQQILDAAGMPEIGRWIRSHHERWDGGGYPDGLAGTDIPLASRMLNVAASFEAMTSHRAWHKPLDLESAVHELRLCAGTQFDPHVVDVFARLVEGMQAAPAPVALEKLGMDGR